MHYFVYILAFAFVSCTTPRKYTLSKFSYNTKLKNSYIVNRIPDYGDGHKDGCLILGEMHFYLNKIAKNSFTGIVKDAYTNTVLKNADIIIEQTGSENKLTLFSNEEGAFEFSLKETIKKIHISYLGYRSLTIDFTERHLIK